MNILDKLNIRVKGPKQVQEQEVKNGPVKGNLKNRSGAIVQSASEKMTATISKARAASDKLQTLLDGSL